MARRLFQGYKAAKMKNNSYIASRSEWAQAKIAWWLNARERDDNHNSSILPKQIQTRKKTEIKRDKQREELARANLHRTRLVHTNTEREAWSEPFKYNCSIDHLFFDSFLKCKTHDHLLIGLRVYIVFLFFFFGRLCSINGIAVVISFAEMSASAEVWIVILLKFMFVFVSDYFLIVSLDAFSYESRRSHQSHRSAQSVWIVRSRESAIG